ncbi:hypothetical protein RUM44_010924 [Polyplax serrata]|uniref:Uncharacterized protein n=1 Tax=Polyplax serrata TaxID=468196 RepID=A0ABR1ANM4_POLSC
MAPGGLLGYILNSTCRLLIRRYAQNSTSHLRSFNTSLKTFDDLRLPIKYTTSKAAKLTINENLNLTNYTKNYAEQPFNRWKRYSVTISVLIFLIYFCILREENDIDEMLSGSHEKSEKYKKLIDLQYLSAPVKTTIDEANLPPPTKVDQNLIDYLERVSLVGFDNEKAVKIVEGAIRFADQIFNVDTSNVQPLISVLEDEIPSKANRNDATLPGYFKLLRCLHLREDIPKSNITRSELLSHATISIENYYIAPTGIANKKATFGTQQVIQ